MSLPPERPSVSVVLWGGGCGTGGLRRALRSVLAQSLSDPIEILLPDHGLPEGAADVAATEIATAARPAPALRLLRGEAERAPADALADAIEAARGRFYHVLEGSAYWSDPEKLRRQVAVLDARPDLAGVAHRTLLRSPLDGTEALWPPEDPEIPVLDLPGLLSLGVRFHGSALLFRNRFPQGAGGARQVPAIFRTGTDGDIRLYVHAAAGGIGHVPQVMSVQDERPGAPPPTGDAPERRAMTRALHDHGYLGEPGDPATAAHLTQRLAEIGDAAPTALRPLSLHPRGARRQRVTALNRVASLLDLEIRLSALTATAGSDPGAHEEALWLIRSFVSALTHDPTLARVSRTRRIATPELDWHCGAIGAAIGAARGILPPPRDPDAAADGPLVLVVSGLADDGTGDGILTQVLDIIALWRVRGPVVVLSSETLPTLADAQGRVGADVELLLNTDHTLVEKTAWLMWHLARLAPSRVLVVADAADVVIAAGMHRNHASRIHLVDGCAAGVALGRHSEALDGIAVRRPHDMAYVQRILPKREILLLPYFASTPPAPTLPETTTPPRLASGPPVTATAARDGDGFDGAYDYGLDRMIPLMIASGAARHVHLGDLSARMRDRIERALAAQGIAPGAFVHLPWSDDPGGALCRAGANLVLQGFPRPDPRVLMAAQAAGLPAIAHRGYLHPMLALDDLCPPDAPCWSDPEDLAAILAAASPDWIAARAAATADHMTARTSARAVVEALGTDFLHPVPPEAVPDVAVPETRHELRRVVSELLETTVLSG